MFKSYTSNGNDSNETPTIVSFSSYKQEENRATRGSTTCCDNKRILYSSSSSDNDQDRKRKSRKRKHSNSHRKHSSAKRLLKSLPTIADEKCMFRKMKFLEDLDQLDRKNNYFIDALGNKYISEYKSISKTDIPRYSYIDILGNKCVNETGNDKRKKKSKKSRVDLSDRYYQMLRKEKSCIIEEQKFVKRKKCDRHCVCQQTFIPVSFDVERKKDYGKEEQDLVMDKLSELKATIANNPHNIDAWLELVSLQSEANCIGFAKRSCPDSVVIEKQISILEDAIGKNQNNLKLHLQRLQLGANVWTPEKIQREWQQLIFIHNTNIDVWRFYIAQLCRLSTAFTVDKVITAYHKCFSTFFNILAGRNKTKSIESLTVYQLCDLFADYCDFLASTGFVERATACWIANIEFNILVTSDSRLQQFGNLMDDPLLQEFQRFWQIQQQSNSSFRTLASDCCSSLQTMVSRSSDSTEQSLMAADGISEAEMWLRLEQARYCSFWLPLTNPSEDLEDNDRFVPFAIVLPSLLTLHNPCNLSDKIMPDIVSVKSKTRLLLLFFEYLGVTNDCLSVRYDLPVGRMRFHQLDELPSVRAMLIPLQRQRMFLPNFIHCCLQQLRSVIDDDDWRESISVLELSYHCRMNRMADTWKQAVASIRQTAQTVLAPEKNNRLLWLTYSDQLLQMCDEPLFLESQKAVGWLLKEAGKVLDGLEQELDELSIDHRLEVIKHWMRLLGKQNKIRELSSKLAVGRTILCKHYGCDEFGDILTAAEMRLDACWPNAILFYGLDRLFHLNLEEFRYWMVTDFAEIVVSIGNICSWSSSILYRFSSLFDSLAFYIGLFCRNHQRNEHAMLRSIFGSLISSINRTQATVGRSIIDAIVSPRLMSLCIGSDINNPLGGQTMAARNFFWNILAAADCDQNNNLIIYNYCCHASSVLLLSMELHRMRCLSSLSSSDDYNVPNSNSSRTERIRSIFNRLLDLRCMHWKYRLSVWLSLLGFEASQLSGGPLNHEDRTKGIFYRAVAEMPSQKMLYLAGTTLSPSILEEAVGLMKTNKIRIFAPLEEIRLLMQIKEKRASSIVNHDDNK